ncbi:MAG: Riboflavin kinase [Candidatus Thorarchaeota archaeon]|nr:MAG: Riboflavin kinase [Candidatus Thorarchaeota archaeon]
MTSPDTWFTVYTLACKGAIHRNVTMTTRELGDALDLSQQTASRRISDCVEEGLVSRAHTASGMILRITPKGRKELERIYKNLEIAMAPPSDEIVIIGEVVKGIGEGAYYVEVYSDRFEEELGFKPYAGTLNVRINDEMSRKAVSQMKHTPPLIVQGFTNEGRTFGDVICYRVKVNEEINAAIVIAQRTHHSQDILEIIAPVSIRDKLKLGDKDQIRITVIPLHLAP